MAQDLGPNASQESLGKDGLQTAIVTYVDYETLRVSIRMVTGEEYTRLPFAMTFPGAGARRFLGSLPEVGDMCIVGYAATSGVHQTPIILGWYVPGATAGHDWWPTQPFSNDEFGFTAAEQERYKGIVDRTRHKLRHVRPGEVLASSSQGSDLVLNEGVTLTNRRGGEVRLRDQDQAFLVRSVVEYHALSGARVYAGTVHREGILLPSSVVSDGTQYDTLRLQDASGNPVLVNGLSLKNAALAPPTGTYLANSVFDQLPMGSVNPNLVLRNGLFFDSSGRVAPGTVSDATYGGKSLFRVAASADATNAAGDASIRSLTEYRVEVAHTSDGTLPVTEQTDGFDADRLPPTDPRAGAESSANRSTNAAYIESVIGTVVGNDPFSTLGRQQYGHPLRPIVFPTPSIATGLGTNMAEHAASLFRITPPLDPKADPTWWSTTKDGRFKASIAGPKGSPSVEALMSNGFQVATGKGSALGISPEGTVRINAKEGNSQTNLGVEVSSDTGAVRIYAGGNSTSGGPLQRTAPTTGGEAALPGLSLEARQNVLVKAGKSITLSAPELLIQDNGKLNLTANTAVNVSAGDTLTTTAKKSYATTTGKSVQTFGGPTDANPANGPVREVVIAATPGTGFVGGVADRYTMSYGDRVESFLFGNHTTSVSAGDMTYETDIGTFTAKAGTSQLQLSETEAELRGAQGVRVTAMAGAATLEGATTAFVFATSTVGLRGAVVHLTATTGGKSGPIVSGADLDPLTGIPLLALGMGSPTHLLNPPDPTMLLM
jgi:hypothetical protein